MSHRGPNASKVNTYPLSNGKNLTLGHTRLSIIDLSERSNQPFSMQNYILSFNGEIYNYKELRQDLESHGIQFSTNSDTEVLINAYACWGNGFLSKLNGMFAFVLWDQRLQKLLVVRDRFGEKPLFWAHLPADEGIIFASEMKVIMGYEGFRPHIAQDSLKDYIEKGWSLTRNHKTPFNNIYQLEPATALIINENGEIEKEWKYWIPEFSPDRISENKSASISEFYEIFEDSVLKRADCDVQIGACLSGGVDSTSIVGILNKHKPTNFHSTISVRFDDDPTISEGNYIDLAARMFNHRHHMISPKADDFIKDASKIHWHHEMPLPSISMFLEWSVMKTAKEIGNTVMLDGQGSDELLGGYPYYFPQYQKEAFFHGELYNLFRNTTLFRSRLMTEAKKYPDYERRINLNTFLNFTKVASLCFKDTIKFLINRRGFSKKAPDGFTFIEPYKKQIIEGIQHTVLQEQLHSADRNGMAFGIEARFPFLDYKLVDYSIKLSRNLLVHEGYQKYILRKALEGLIPSKITTRSDKLGFLPPQDKWITGPLAHWIKERAHDPIIQKIPFYSKENMPQDSANLWMLNWRWASLAEWLSVYNFKLS